VLRDVHDAEDAFQTVFLVLVHKARHIREPRLLGSWLHGVALRTAQNLRGTAARRSRLEWEAAAMSSRTTWEPGNRWDELRSRLDAELDALPEKYRAPLVLCYLEGKSHAEAAQLLGWPSGSISARVNRGRDLLRRRLAGRDRKLHASIFPFLLGCFADSSPVPSRLVEDTIAVALAAFPGDHFPGPDASTALVAELALGELPAPARPLFARYRKVFVLCIAAFLILSATAYAIAGFNILGPYWTKHPVHTCH
jgi:RNA polymerase sigma-70 factor (ECF subfamily)